MLQAKRHKGESKLEGMNDVGVSKVAVGKRTKWLRGRELRQDPMFGQVIEAVECEKTDGVIRLYSGFRGR